MSRRVTNALLLVAVAVLVATGLVAWVLPESRATPLYDIHRMTGLALVLALPWKEVVARASLARRIRRAILPTAAPGILATLALAATLILGVAWTAGLVSFDRPSTYSAMNLHVFAGLALVPLAAWHVIRRWELPRARDLASRRAAIRVLGLAGISIAGGMLLSRTPLLEALGAEPRRVTGSKHAGSFTGNAFPLTIWSFDQVPAIDTAAWRLELSGALVDRRAVSWEDLNALPSHETDAILDCTGGWWSEQRWRGVSLLELLEARGLASGPRTISVISVTGHSWSFGRDELEAALLATHVGGEPLSAGHGAPVRLVIPGRRGFQWIKWVARIDAA